MTATVTMWRPAGRAELDLVEASGFRHWPPRLPEQPIFYPVTNERYALEVNRWNVTEQGEGFVTRFEVRADFAEQFPVERVGAEHHTEWWIPADRLDELNGAIVGLIEVVHHVTA